MELMFSTTTLDKLSCCEINHRSTTIIIGNSMTYIEEGYMVNASWGLLGFRILYINFQENFMKDTFEGDVNEGPKYGM